LLTGTETQIFSFIHKLLDTGGFPPRWFCGQWTHFHGWLYVISDLAIWGAYTSIPLILLYFTRRIKDLPFPRIFWLFAAFIYACGTTHLLDATMFWWPAYRLTAVVELITAVISWITVFALIPAIPQALAFKSPKELEKIIAERTTELRKLEDQRRQFIAALSHDMRTPLAAEKVALGALRKQASVVSKQNEDLYDSLLQNNADLINLVNQLIEKYQYEEGKVILNPSSIDLEVFLDEIFISIQPLSEIKNIGLEKSIAPDARYIYGDYYQLKRVFMNLLGNACANLPSHCLLSVTTFLRASQVHIKVKDNGPGIGKEVLAHLFEPYYSNRRKLDKIGSGLGLSIVKHIVELHQGAITVASNHGQGTTFTITLPHSKL